METQSIGDILNGTEAPAAAPVTQDAPVVETAAPAAEPKGEPDAPPASQSKSEEVGQLAALKAEREKRQDIERQLNELKAKQQEQPQRPDPLDDPEGAYKFDQSQYDQKLFDERLNMSEMLTREKHGDDLVNESRDMFMAAVSQDPALGAKLRSAVNPYDFVVKWAKKEKSLREIGDDPEAWKLAQLEKMKAEILAGSTPPAAPEKREAVPESLATERNVGGAREAPYAGPAPLGDLLKAAQKRR